jgi:16S rRNA (guanine(966)-N(2))-methyltransferase RsmD
MSKPSTKSAAPTVRRAAPRRSVVNNQVRIIGGQWKRSILAVLAADGLRPTPDRVRETVFNWLNHLFDGAWAQVSCLDLFAGTGALGFEAASRGAARVVLVESFAPALRQLEANKEKLKADQITVLRGDALANAQRFAGGSPFQLIFLDPPYHQDWLAKVLPLCAPLLAAGGVIYVESEVALDQSGVAAPEWLADWDVVRADRAGTVFYHLLQRKNLP